MVVFLTASPNVCLIVTNSCSLFFNFSLFCLVLSAHLKTGWLFGTSLVLSVASQAEPKLCQNVTE